MDRSTLRFTCLLFLGAPLVASVPEATAQVVLHEHEGDSPQYSGFGYSGSSAGDLDGDGVEDLLVGEPYFVDGTTAQLVGRVHVYSGLTGGLIRTHDAPTSNEHHYFGFSVASIGDVNGDGVADYAIGSPASASFAGSVTVHSGATGSLLWSAVNANRDELLGYTLSRAGDVDRDGFPDLLAARPGADSVDVYSGNGTRLYTVHQQALGSFGWALAALGDVDGDGASDFAVGGPYASEGAMEEVGRVNVYSGATGSLLHHSLGDQEYSLYGYSLGACGDVNGDGAGDYVAGAPYEDVGTAVNAGMARVMSGKQNAILRKHLGASVFDQLGTRVAGTGDVNRDGVGDYLVGAPSAGFAMGLVNLYSGQGGGLMWQLHGEGGSPSFGYSLAGGDFNADGIGDWLIGDPSYYEADTGNIGALYVYAGCPAHAGNYGAGWPGTNGVPTLVATAPPALGETAEITIGNSSGGPTMGLLLVGFQSAHLPTSAGGTLLVVPSINLLFPLSGASVTLRAGIPDDTSLCFVELFAQALEADPGASHGISFTDGLEMTIGFDLP